MDDGQIGSGEENTAGDDDNSNNSLALMPRHREINDEDDIHDGDEDDDENDGDTSNLPLNLVATQFAE